MKVRKKIIFALILSALVFQISAQEKSLLESTSKVNWVTKKFNSNINLNVDKANIKMPSGKTTAINKIKERTPDLIKDPLLTLNVDSNNKLGDCITDQEITYNNLNTIILNSKSTLGFFKKDSSDFSFF